MPPRRMKIKRKTIRKPRAKRARGISAVSVRKIVKKEMNKTVETKRSCASITDGQQIAHNSFITLDNTLFSTSQGSLDPTNNNTFNRIGDEVLLRGISCKMMLELNERYSDVTYRILLVKSARFDVPTAATLFNGLSGNKMLDSINTERYTILYQKWGKIRAGNFGGQTPSGGLLSGGGLYDVGGTNVNLYSRQTKIVKFWLSPKILKMTVVKYENSSSAVKFFDYNLLIYAYSNYSTSEALGFNVLTVNDYIRQMYFKDA